MPENETSLVLGVDQGQIKPVENLPARPETLTNLSRLEDSIRATYPELQKYHDSAQGDFQLDILGPDDEITGTRDGVFGVFASYYRRMGVLNVLRLNDIKTTLEYRSQTQGSNFEIKLDRDGGLTIVGDVDIDEVCAAMTPLFEGFQSVTLKRYNLNLVNYSHSHIGLVEDIEP
jgi:hypothetical protein